MLRRGAHRRVVGSLTSASSASRAKHSIAVSRSRRSASWRRCSSLAASWRATTVRSRAASYTCVQSVQHTTCHRKQQVFGTRDRRHATETNMAVCFQTVPHGALWLSRSARVVESGQQARYGTRQVVLAVLLSVFKSCTATAVGSLKSRVTPGPVRFFGPRPAPRAHPR